MLNEEQRFELRKKQLESVIVENSPMGDITRRVSLKIAEGMAIDSGLPCGECRECCTAMGVYEMDKPNHQSCRYECETGCSIYNRKPKSCNDFECLWKRRVVGNGELRFRPDRIGLVPIIEHRLEFGPLIVCFMETKPGSAENATALELIKETIKQFPITFGMGDGKATALFATDTEYDAVINYLGNKNDGSFQIANVDLHIEQGN